MGLTLITAPASTPVSLAELKAHCRVHADDTSYNTELQLYLDAAVSHLDGKNGILQHCIVSQTWDLTLDAFADNIEIPLAPVQSVTYVKYYDSAGDLQTLSSDYYTVDTSSLTQWIVRNEDYTYPSPLDAVNVVIVRFVAGYSTVPVALKQAILLLAGHWFAHREAVSPTPMTDVPLAVEALVAPYKRMIFA